VLIEKFSHKSFKGNQNFSPGTIDIPAMVDFALTIAQQSDLHYIGHSQGTTSFFVGASAQKDLNSRVRTMHALGE
jgi:lysosomal acid lipase/cholesteryl ester hydrolase